MKQPEMTTRTFIELKSRTSKTIHRYLVVDRHGYTGEAETLMGIREIYTVKSCPNAQPRIMTVFNDMHVTVMNRAGKTTVMDWKNIYDSPVSNKFRKDYAI